MKHLIVITALLTGPAIAQTNKCGLRPIAPMGCSGSEASCVCSESGNCRWEWNCSQRNSGVDTSIYSMPTGQESLRRPSIYDIYDEPAGTARQPRAKDGNVTQWEYRIERYSLGGPVVEALAAQLAGAGREGWELCGIGHFTGEVLWIFKRPLKAAKKK